MCTVGASQRCYTFKVQQNFVAEICQRSPDCHVYRRIHGITHARRHFFQGIEEGCTPGSRHPENYWYALFVTESYHVFRVVNLPLILCTSNLLVTSCRRSQIGCLPYFYTRCGLSVNLECRSEMCCTCLAENTGHKNGFTELSHLVVFNRGRHLYSFRGWPSRWAQAHILVFLWH